MTDKLEPNDVIDFWFTAGMKNWFKKSDAFDKEVTDRFKTHHVAARDDGMYDFWAETPEGTLALIILLDQFARNMFRGSPEMFAADAKAMATTYAALDKEFDEALENDDQRSFVYMPLMHSERLEDQQQCVKLFKSRKGLKHALSFAVDHHDIIERFGRFPHRNPLVGRTTTPDEQTFLDRGGFKG